MQSPDVLVLRAAQQEQVVAALPCCYWDQRGGGAGGGSKSFGVVWLGWLDPCPGRHGGGAGGSEREVEVMCLRACEGVEAIGDESDGWLGYWC